MKNSRKQAGSAHVAIVVILVVIILGLLGFVFWQNFINKKSPVSSTSVTKTTSSVTPTNLSANSVKQTANGLYSVYPSSGNCSGANVTTTAQLLSCEDAVLQPYVTVNLEAKMNAYLPDSGESGASDPILCLLPGGAGPSPTYVAGNVSTTTDSATGIVNMTFPSDSSLAGTYAINFTAVSQSGTIKIDTITCPALPNS